MKKYIAKILLFICLPFSLCGQSSKIRPGMTRDEFKKIIPCTFYGENNMQIEDYNATREVINGLEGDWFYTFNGDTLKRMTWRCEVREYNRLNFNKCDSMFHQTARNINLEFGSPVKEDSLFPVYHKPEKREYDILFSDDDYKMYWEKNGAEVELEFAAWDGPKPYFEVTEEMRRK